MDVRSDLSYVTIVVEPRSLTVPPQTQGTGTSRSSCLLVWSVVSYKRCVHLGLGSAASLALTDTVVGTTCLAMASSTL